MIKSRSRSIDLGGSWRGAEPQLATRFSWRTKLLCGIYSQEMTSSVFYIPENEDVYLRRRPCSWQEEDWKNKKSEHESETDSRMTGGTGENLDSEISSGKNFDKSKTESLPMRQYESTLKHKWITKSRRWSITPRKTGEQIKAPYKSFQQRFHKAIMKKMTGSLDDLHHHRDQVLDCDRVPTPQNKHYLKKRHSVKMLESRTNEEIMSLAVAIRDFHPSPYDKEALSFRRGDRIQVIRMEPTGIWRGRCNGKEGNFKFVDVRTVKMIPQRPCQPSFVVSHISKSQSVSDLLSSMSLENLTPVFVLNGYDTVEDMEHICEGDLEYLGIQDGETKDLLMQTAHHLDLLDSGITPEDLDGSCSSSASSEQTDEDSRSDTNPSFLYSSFNTGDSGISITDIFSEDAAA